jgi:hypothetical protein
LFFASPAGDFEPSISPDGRWIAYNDAATGEVYVRPVSGQGQWLVSADGSVGHLTRWSKTSSEMYYGTEDGRLMAVPYTAERNSFRAERPRLVGRFLPGFFGADFDAHPDGERFALRAVPEDETERRRDELVFVFNFFEELERLLPTDD